jgi:hypothetical protein
MFPLVLQVISYIQVFQPKYLSMRATYPAYVH